MAFTSVSSGLKAQIQQPASDTALLNHYFKIGLDAYYDYQNDTAILYFKRAIKLGEEIEEESKLAEANYYLGELYAYTGDYDLALEHYFRGMDYYSIHEELTGLNNCYFGIGLVYKYKGYFNVARTYYQLSVDLCREMNDTLGLADVYNNLGTVEKSLGNYPRAMEYFSDVLEIARKNELEIHEITALNNIAQLHDLQGSSETAFEYYKESLELARKVNNRFYLFVPLVNLASAYAQSGEYNKALDLFNEALVLSNVTNNNARVAHCYSELGSLMRQMGNYGEAQNNYKQALLIAQKNKNRGLESELYLSLSKLELSISNYAVANAYARQSLNIANSTQALPDKANAYQQLYTIAAKQGLYKEGLAFHENWIELKDSLYTIEKIKAIEELEIQYQVRVKTDENVRLKSEAAIMRQVLEQRKRVLLLLGIGVALSLLIVALLFAQRRNRKKLHLQEEAIHRHRLEILNNKIEFQERELVTKSMFVAERNTTVERIIEQLDELAKNSDGQSIQIRSLIRQLNFDLKDQKHWKEFEAHFNQVHPGFYTRLNEKYPGLTANERKLTAFLKMKLVTKDISGITGQSVKSVEVARTRLRKKFGMLHDDNLYDVIERI